MAMILMHQIQHSTTLPTFSFIYIHSILFYSIPCVGNHCTCNLKRARITNLYFSLSQPSIIPLLPPPCCFHSTSTCTHKKNPKPHEQRERKKLRMMVEVSPHKWSTSCYLVLFNWLDDRKICNDNDNQKSTICYVLIVPEK